MKEVIELLEKKGNKVGNFDRVPNFKISGNFDGKQEENILSSLDASKIPDFNPLDIIQSSLDPLKTNIEVIKETSPFSEALNSFIKTLPELHVYLDAGLEEGVVNDKVVLKDNTIDPDLKDAMGRTNLERMKLGLAPLDKNGESYNLHHIGQERDSPLAELKNGTHKENDSILHDSSITESKIDRGEFSKERAGHWKTRAEEI